MPESIGTVCLLRVVSENGFEDVLLRENPFSAYIETANCLQSTIIMPPFVDSHEQIKRRIL